ncbi:MAG: hypothetical protein IPL58_11910 [Betaproteobacteria bacterium]|uniref:Pilus assembly protein PilX n=1 Tax=Candidatus Proximibacter danicus TaxID=2954365 RepID=A0A9D7PQQ5_9PROT|nr:hypothetical protein [Candidatus Proximibacter danicus]MBK9445846.1 hypothetical protein [Betaproteobacteria bacterium]
MKNLSVARPFRRREGGVVLVTAVMFLVVLTLLVISMMRTSILEERMAGYSRDWNIAFQAAESALRAAEREVRDGINIVGQTGFVYGCSTSSTPGGRGPGLCLPNLCTETNSTNTDFDCWPIWKDLMKHPQTSKRDAGWVDGTSASPRTRPYNYTDSLKTIPDVAAQPRYIIEVLTVPEAASLKPGSGAPSQKFLYRVTAVGFGKSANTRVTLQGNYRQY